MRSGLIELRTHSLRVSGGSLALALVFFLVLAAGISAQSFWDVRGDEWFADSVDALAAEGIVSGRDDGSFGPFDPVTRAQLAALLARTLDLPDSPNTPFTDVTSQDWFAGAVGALHQAGIVSGTDSVTFSPHLPVNRQQAATLIMRALSYELGRQPGAGGDYILPWDSAGLWLAGFRDRALIGLEHAESVANAYRLGIIEGAADAWFYPSLTLNRAQMAAILCRAFLQPIVPRRDLSGGAGGSIVLPGPVGRLRGDLWCRSWNRGSPPCVSLAARSMAFTTTALRMP